MSSLEMVQCLHILKSETKVFISNVIDTGAGVGGMRKCASCLLPLATANLEEF